MGKTLVAYFSASGVTARTAEKIAQAVGADLYEIAPEAPYTAADLNWRNKRSRSSVEMEDPSSRPAVAGALPDASGYDAVFLGFPIWWYVESRIVDTFLEAVAAQLAGVPVIPFATSGGSGIAGAEKRLREVFPEVSWRPGKLVSGPADAASWARGVLA